jgi:uncharacterized coiled-coil protein SlyX
MIKLADLLPKTMTVLRNFFDRLMQQERSTNLSDLLAESAKWQPSAENYTYKQEMYNRDCYLRGAMQDDMIEELTRRFPQTHKDIEKEQVNLALYKKQMTDRASVFLDNTTFSLVDEENQEDEDTKDAFQKFIRDTKTVLTLKQIDLYTQSDHRAMGKAWWDTRGKRVCLSVWPSRQVDIVPDPVRYWDCDSAPCVLFELPGYEGLMSTQPRREVWGFRPQEDAAATGQKTVHFITDGVHDYALNEEDKNPFVDPRTGAPLYPFVWFCDGTEKDQLYTIGDEDALTINRTVNSGLTDIRQAIHYKAFGVWVETLAQSQETGLTVQTISPSRIVTIPFGGRLDNIATNLPISETMDFYDRLMDKAALFGGLSPSAVRADATSPESGYALKIRNAPLTEHRLNMIEVYRGLVEEFIYRALVVHNTYSDEQIAIDGLRVQWTPGTMEVEMSPQEEGTAREAEIARDVSTAVDWRMDEYGEDRETAEANVRENAELNAELAKLGRPEPPPMMMEGLANRFGGQAPKAGEVAKEEAPVIDEPQDEDEEDAEE